MHPTYWCAIAARFKLKVIALSGGFAIKAGRTIGGSMILALQFFLLVAIVFVLSTTTVPKPKTRKVLSMDIFAVFAQLKANIEALTAQLADTEAAVNEAKLAAYNEGFAAGQASVSTDKIYSQEELDQKVLEAVDAAKAEMASSLEASQAKVAELELKVADLEAVVAGMDAKIAEAIAAFKADLLAQFEAQQDQESAGESMFKDLLK